MRTIITTIILLIAAFKCFAQNSDIEILKKLNHDWISAYPTHDTATMSRIFADDLVLISPNGKAFHKKDILKNLMSPDPEYISTKVDTVSVRLFGNIGLVNAKTTGVVKANNQTNTFQTCYLDVYEKRNGRWYAVASQVALIDGK